jgi:hypothetical protein
LPEFSLRDQAGRIRSLQSVFGPKGAVIVFFRSQSIPLSWSIDVKPLDRERVKR